MLYPKLNQYRFEPMPFNTRTISNITGVSRSMMHNRIDLGMITPEIPAKNSGLPHRYSCRDSIRICHMGELVKFGLSWETASFLINSIDDQAWGQLLDQQWRYLAIYANHDGEFGKPFFINSMEFDAEFKEFKMNQQFMLVIDGQKILKKIESKL